MNYLYLLLADKKGQAQLGDVTFHCTNISMIVSVSEFILVKGGNWMERIEKSHQLNDVKEGPSIP